MCIVYVGQGLIKIPFSFNMDRKCEFNITRIWKRLLRAQHKYSSQLSTTQHVFNMKYKMCKCFTYLYELALLKSQIFCFLNLENLQANTCICRRAWQVKKLVFFSLIISIINSYFQPLIFIKYNQQCMFCYKQTTHLQRITL